MENEASRREKDILETVSTLLGADIDLEDSSCSQRDLLVKLRERLKAAGGREVLSDEEWRAGASSIGRQLTPSQSSSSPTKQKEEYRKNVSFFDPPVDVFYEDEEVVIVTEIPGLELDDLQVSLEENALFICTGPAAPKRFHKKVALKSPVEKHSMSIDYRNGILEIRLPIKR
ncbi:MAG: hypothetical protein AVO34_04880 [Firmicutes bacterium ML8_F2]|jgi:HSP20 family molecular chaperone IbpA|nr:MAG: hypothetical protein AVO34_04880 [Firmicutes bacterium ML8_F2]